MSDKVGEPERPMTLIGSRTLHRNTKEVLDHVEHHGEPVVILRYGRPIAAVVPIDEEQAKTLVMASAPQLQGRLNTQAVDEHAEPRTFAVAEREIGRNDAVTRAEITPAMHDESTPATDVMHRRIETATEMQFQTNPGHGKIVTIAYNVSLLEIRQGQTQALADLVGDSVSRARR